MKVMGMRMPILLMFVASFLVEMCSTAYTISVVQHKDAMTVILSLIHEILGWAILLAVVSDLSLAPASIAGNLFGTTLALKLRKT